MRNSVYDAIKNCFLWNNDSNTYELALRLGVEEDFKKGENISRIGSIGILLSGDGIVCGKNRKVVLRRIASSDIFGAATLFGGDATTEIIARSGCKVFYLCADDMVKIFDFSGTTAKIYIHFLTQRIAFLNSKMDGFLLASAEQKLYDFLKSNSSKGEYIAPCSFLEVSKRLSIGRTSLYRALDSLQIKKYITKTKGKIVLCDGETLL